MAVEKYLLPELRKLIETGHKYRLFKPFMFQGQILINIEKILTVKDLDKLEGKIFGPIETVSTIEHNTDDKTRKALLASINNILKTSPLFHVDDVKHLNFDKRKECEKILNGIISESPHLVMLLLQIYKKSKKLFVHSINVGIISTVLDLGIQENQTHHDGLRSEIILTSALLHDVGFIKMPDALLNNKRIDYSDDEKNTYMTHSVVSAKLIASMGSNFRSEIPKIIAQHHEKLNGSGFPHGLKDKEIYPLSLIVALADEFELTITGEVSNNKKSYSEIMSRMSHMGSIYGNTSVDSLYKCFRYLI